MLATGATKLVTMSGADVAEQPAVVTVTVYEPATETVIDCVVAPVDQRLPVADDEVSVIVMPVHESVEGPVMVGVTAPPPAATTNGADVAEQPASVTVTVYVPATETAIDCVVAPVDQRFPVAEDEVSVIEPPAQESEAGPVIVGTAGADAPATMKPAEVAEQPLAFVTVTV